MEKNIKPTRTLAEIYESQNQYLDALKIYQALYRMEPNEYLRAKIVELNSIVFTTDRDAYNNLINRIFTKEDKEYFKIISHEHFLNFNNLLADNEKQ